SCLQKRSSWRGSVPERPSKTKPVIRRLIDQKFVTAHADIFRCDQLFAGHGHGMQPPLDLLDTRAEEFIEFRKLRGMVVFLPDIALQEAGVIGHVIKDFRRCQAVITQLEDQACHIPNLLLRMWRIIVSEVTHPYFYLITYYHTRVKKL